VLLSDPEQVLGPERSQRRHPPGPRSGTFPKQQAPNQNSLPSSYAWDMGVIYSRGGTLLTLLVPGVQSKAGRGPCLGQPQSLLGPYYPKSRTRSPGHPGVLQALPCLLGIPLGLAVL